MTARTIFALVLAVALSGPSALAGPFQCPSFRRGDANVDSAVDVSDAVRVLFGLFVGGGLPCEDAADADDSGKVEMTDAVFLLTYLFLGGNEPPYPGPGRCGTDWSGDALGCENAGSCRPVVTTEDLSGFTRFRYAQRPALGFCPEPDAVYCATIVRAGDGEYRLDLSIRTDQDEIFDSCPTINSSCEGDCGIIEHRESRTLETSEVEAMLDVFTAVEVTHGPDPICDCVAIDPCSIEEFGWDGFTVSGFLCSGTRLDQEPRQALKSFLESLRTP